MNRNLKWRLALCLFMILLGSSGAMNADQGLQREKPMEKIKKSEEEWKKILTADQYHITRQKGTEPPFTGVYYQNKETGTYHCVGCGLPLFSSKTKFDSGTGWPSYWQPITESNIELKEDHSFFMQRIEVVCSRCESHLGHVFDDGPMPTGKRYCINSGALKFTPAEKQG